MTTWGMGCGAVARHKIVMLGLLSAGFGACLGVPVLAAAQADGVEEAASADDTSAADDEAARTHFEAGRLHYEEGAYDRALEEFERAWELSHRPALLVNLATTRERLGQYLEAAENLREYLRLSPGADNQTRYQRRIANLERLERERGTAGDSRNDGALVAVEISGFVLAGVGVATMAVFGGLALAADDTLASGCGATASCTEADVADANTFALVSDVGLAVGLVGAAVGTVFALLALGADADPGDDDGGVEATASPWLSPDGAGVFAQMRY